MKIIGISGRLGTGKDTVAKLIEMCTFTPYQHRKFAGKLKEMTCLLLGCTLNQLEDQEFKERSMGPEWGDITPRLVMQRMGTEFGRGLYENLWVKSAMANMNPEQNYIFTDCRFENEAQAIKNEGGKVILVTRPGKVVKDSHPSETALDNYHQWDYVLLNEGSMEDLGVKVAAMCKKLNL